MSKTKTGQKVAYIRVSTEDQNTARQEGLQQEVDKVFREKASAGSRNRPVLNEMMNWVREGDEVHVWSMDRLARSLKDMLDIVEELMAKGVSVHFKKENLSFIPGTDDPYAKLTLQLLGAFAEFERNIIKSRQAEGIVKAKERGAYKGRKACLTEEQTVLVREKSELKIPVSEVARQFGVSRSTIYKVLKES